MLLVKTTLDRPMQADPFKYSDPDKISTSLQEQSSRVISSKSSITLHTSLSIKAPLRNHLKFDQIRRKRLQFTQAIFRKSDSGQSSDSATSVQDDFVTRVLKENPSQVEPKYKIGDKFYTLKEKENLGKKGYDGNGALEIIKRLNLKGLNDNRSLDGVDYPQDVHLNDILRKFKGKLYVPEQIFVEELSEEAEFNREFELLPRMSFDDLQKTVRTNMIKFMTFKDDDKVAYGHNDLIVELKEIPGDKNLQRTKWHGWKKCHSIQIQLHHQYQAGLLGVFKITENRLKPLSNIINFRKWDIWQGIEFSQSKPQARVDGSTGVTFDDVAGIEIAVEELQELVKYLKNPELFDKMGIKPPHGVLLEGPPGCDKTLVAKAIAGEAGVPFYQMAGSEFVEVLVGVGSARIRDLFKRAKVPAPVLQQFYPENTDP
ncbi:hypothetical protein E3N88_45694 [Mikania micrantha]|uniref:ATPase AAA-type core domain-containing protein n=1 Tax=Mikania micrantha TaxID=192012 RepID=A0A5N6L8J3_9ASTR|nr:hypothetical protein E3N88_45694 [Mikania micrantha]